MEAERHPLPEIDDLVLVAVLPSPRDLEIARVLGWYRIPLRYAPRILAVDYLAFYQPTSFGVRGGRIENVARVSGYELTTRRQLLQGEAEHPRAGEEYFKIQLRGLAVLPKPVLAAGWKRLAFLYTTGGLLLSARTLNDLVLEGEERTLLWRSIRERALADRRYHASDVPGPELPPSALAELLGMVSISQIQEAHSANNGFWAEV